MNVINQYKNYLKLRNLSPRTIQAYSRIVNNYMDHTNNDPLTADNTAIINFALKADASRTREQIIGALQHLYTGVYKNPQKLKYIPRIKREEFLPNTLTVTETHKLIETIPNIKHKAVISLIYYGALRISEAINLKIEHINKNGIIKIEQSKGKKDRMVPLPEVCINLMRQYYKTTKPNTYLFNGQSSLQYSEASITKTLKRYLSKLKITKTIRVHDLRHSRATHLLEGGMDVRFLQEMLGHKRIETTQRYLHVATKSLQTAINNAEKQLTT